MFEQSLGVLLVAKFWAQWAPAPGSGQPGPCVGLASAGAAVVSLERGPLSGPVGVIPGQEADAASSFQTREGQRLRLPRRRFSLVIRRFKTDGRLPWIQRGGPIPGFGTLVFTKQRPRFLAGDFETVTSIVAFQQPVELNLASDFQRPQPCSWKRSALLSELSWTLAVALTANGSEHVMCSCRCLGALRRTQSSSPRRPRDRPAGQLQPPLHCRQQHR